MTYTGAYPVSNEWLALGIETTRGTKATVADLLYIPHLSPSWDPKLSWLSDDAFRGSPGDTYDEVPGVRYDEVGFKTYMRANEFPLYIVAALGGSDAKSGTEAPYTHTIGLYNTPAYGSQPPSFTINWFDGYKVRQWTGCQLTSLSVTFAADGKVEVAHKWVCNPETATPTTTFTPTFATESLIPGWSYSLEYASSVNANVVSGSLDIKRSTKSIFTGGTQGPFQNFAAKCAVSGKLVNVLTAVDTTLVKGLARNQQVATLKFTDEENAGHYVEFAMSALQLVDPAEKPGKEYVEVTSDFKAVMNATDAVTPGYANLKAVIANASGMAVYTKPS